MTVAPEFSIQPNLRKVPYDPIKDFAFVTQLASGQYLLTTHPTVPVKTPREFLALAKARPGQVAFGSSGPGSANHLAGVLFQSMTGTKMLHVPYKSAGAAGTALMGGEIDFMFSNVASAITHVRSGRLRAIATTGEKRSTAVPEVPTIDETAVRGFVVTGFYIMMAPAGTPREIIGRLHAESVKALQTPQLKERLAALGLEPVGSSPDAATAFIRAEIAKWAPVVKAAGAAAE
jgi:tripartite-type tricarboxylate transporter receptor subunit TctC